MTGCTASGASDIAGASFAISSGPITFESIPSSWFTSARSAITNMARSVWARVRCPSWLKRRLKLSSAPRRSYSFTEAS